MSKFDFAGYCVISVRGNIISQHSVFAVDSLKNNRMRTRIKQFAQKIVNLSIGKILSPVFGACKNRGFRNIRSKNVRAVGQSSHRAAQLFGVSRIHFAAVAHNRIYQAKNIRIFFVQSLNNRNLLRVSQKSGINRVESDFFAFPCVKIFAENFCRVVEGENGIARVCREKSSGDRTYVAACGRQNRDCGSQGAFSVSAHVMNGGDARDVSIIALVKNVIVFHSNLRFGFVRFVVFPPDCASLLQTFLRFLCVFLFFRQ